MHLYEHEVFFRKPGLGGNHMKFYTCLQSMVGNSAIILDTKQLFSLENLKPLFLIV